MLEKENTIQAYKNLIIITLGLYIIGYWLALPYYEIVCLGILVLGVISTKLTTFISFLWMKLAEGLGYVNSKILLTVIYVVVLCPLAFLVRLLGKRQLKFQLNPSEESWFVDRNKTYQKEDLENMW